MNKHIENIINNITSKEYDEDKLVDELNKLDKEISSLSKRLEKTESDRAWFERYYNEANRLIENLTARRRA